MVWSKIVIDSNSSTGVYMIGGRLYGEILAGVAFAFAMPIFYGIFFKDAFTFDLLIGVSVAIGLSQLNRKMPLFKICGATK